METLNGQFGTIWTALTTELGEWLEAGVRMLPNLVVALAIVLLTIPVSRFIARGVRAGLSRISDNHQVTGLLATITRTAILAGGVFVALGVLQLDKTVTSLLAGVGIVGLALGFAFQDIAANFMSGLLMSVRRPFEVGDLVKSGDHFGTVERIDLRATVLRQITGERVIVPNKEVFQNAILNYTRPARRRVDVPVGVAYGDDLQIALDAAREAVAPLNSAEGAPEAQAFLTGFGSSSIDLDVRFWIDAATQLEYVEARSNAILAIKRAFDAAGLTIPFPIRTLDFGARVVGGERLDEVMSNVAAFERHAG